VDNPESQTEGLLYLLGNAGLLTAVAMMTAGRDPGNNRGPDRHAPGFPDNGQWTIKCENLKKMP
jgi:hypothetical protein